DPIHPPGLETDEVAERGARIEVRAPRLGEVAGRLGEAEDEDEDRKREDERRPEGEGAEELVRLGGEEEDAAADDGVDAHGHEAPEADGADEFFSHVEFEFTSSAKLSPAERSSSSPQATPPPHSPPHPLPPRKNDADHRTWPRPESSPDRTRPRPPSSPASGSRGRAGW